MTAPGAMPKLPPGSNLIIRRSLRPRPELCPLCRQRAVEAGEEWEVVLPNDDDASVALPLCTPCVVEIGDELRLAIDILNLNLRTTPMKLNDTGPEVPF